ncbi:MAG TPA: anaerobic ribonucleoside-triphosphate reductase activating protein [Saprospiraceae bacterium]|nr:anaerobic ribonucleoside-triphosphate reductase activating protein [Saprospiraceae bacterium]HMT69919.1 anaerobic ribonucleoside-triphosphate reductase activating protein [Saprospiraceae bacterium]HQV96411.1 anaerobic ribonucleoside-triphosphate reductase activating protein [Saprospiraceae bacterium]HRG40078.1 anaerobic ribonucleoside-triphosphate reductase activating protein [Saprospiraceae bacterium]
MNTNKEHIFKKSLQKKLIYNLTPFTLLDYPDKTAIILWFAGCNMRCTYCYNPEIVTGKGKYTFDDIKAFLASRKGFIDAIVLSGGECLLYDGVKDIIAAIKSMGFLVKIDTNGSRPDILQDLIKERLIDYVALDFKATKHKVSAITDADYYDEFIACMRIMLKSDIHYEVRTTVHSALLRAYDIRNMVNILSSIGYTGAYYLQHFRCAVQTIGNPGISAYDIELSTLSNDKIQIIER